MDFVELTATYLKKCKIQLDERFLRNRMLSHPDFPSLVALTDSLDELGLQYGVFQIEKSDLSNIAVPAMLHLVNNDKKEFIIIQSHADMHRKAERLKAWDGIVLVAQKEGKVINYEHEERIKENTKRRVQNIGATALISALFLTLSVLHFNVYSFSFTMLSVVGAAICYLIVLQSVGRENRVITRLCGAASDQGCNKVIKSKVGVLGKNIGLGELGAVYFISSLVLVFSATVFGKWQDVLQFLSLPVALTILFCIFSVCYQGLVLKTWCAMCLIAVSVLLLQAAVFFLALAPRINSLDLKQLFWMGVPGTALLLPYFFLLIAVAVLGIIAIRDEVSRKMAEEEKEIELMKWKRDPHIFNLLLENQQVIDFQPWLEDVCLGNPRADIQIVAVVNPYCGPCASADRQLRELLAVYRDEVCITLRFAVDAANGDKRSVVAGHLINAFHSLRTEDEKERVFSDWFEQMNLNVWLGKWNLPLQHGIENVVKRHQDWCTENKINHTPSIFVNSRKTPPKYDVKDIQLLLPSIIERCRISRNEVLS